jgi:hypothetical protein
MVGMDMRARPLIERVPFNNNVILNRSLSFFSLSFHGQPLRLAVTQIGREKLPAGVVVIAAIVRFLSQKKEEEEEEEENRTKKLCQTMLSCAFSAGFSFDALRHIRLFIFVSGTSVSWLWNHLLSLTLGMP